jgi:hypothetical protein
MSQSVSPPSADILARPQDKHIELAIAAIIDAGNKADGTPKLSQYKAASIYHVPRSTLGDRMKGVPVRAEAHAHQRTLSAAEEEILVEWAKALGYCGVPMTYATLTKYASEISGKAIGESWPKRFLTRHPNLKVKATTGLEKCCAKALNRTAVEGFFDILKQVVRDFDIKPENTWNMDEKGIYKGNLTDLRRILHLSLAKGNPK